MQPLFDFYASHAGCGDGSESVTTRMACLRKASVSALARAQDADGGPVLRVLQVDRRPLAALLVDPVIAAAGLLALAHAGRGIRVHGIAPLQLGRAVEARSVQVAGHANGTRVRP